MKPRYFTIPNILTLGNLFCGCLALMFIFTYGDLRLAFWMVALAALLDFLDGFAARMLKSYSPLGKELDSLADAVSFGVVPAFALYVMYLHSGGSLAYAPAVFLVALFSALRLARFNVDEEQSDEFIGLPTPANALFISSLGYMLYFDKFAPDPVVVLLLAVVMSLLLIAPVRMFSLKFKDFSFRNNVLRYLFLGLALAAVIVLKVAAVPFVIAAYVLVSVIYDLATRKRL